MDPNVCLDRILAALENKDFGEADEAAEDLIQWLRRGGFTPRRSAEIELNKAMTDGMEPEQVPRVDELSQLLKGDD
jgi:hypothetical protein